jgi:hypothetical protein
MASETTPTKVTLDREDKEAQEHWLQLYAAVLNGFVAGLATHKTIKVEADSWAQYAAEVADAALLEFEARISRSAQR